MTMTMPVVTAYFQLPSYRYNYVLEPHATLQRPAESAPFRRISDSAAPSYNYNNGVGAPLKSSSTCLLVSRVSAAASLQPPLRSPQ